ncbi:MAG: hypothetical protein ACI8XG_001595, partial [Congregibacter sp.]
SLYNKIDTIDANVISNCSHNTQTRIRQATEKVVNVDETGLYDLLQKLQPSTA